MSGLIGEDQRRDDQHFETVAREVIARLDAHQELRVVVPMRRLTDLLSRIAGHQLPVDVTVRQIRAADCVVDLHPARWTA